MELMKINWEGLTVEVPASSGFDGGSNLIEVIGGIMANESIEKLT